MKISKENLAQAIATVQRMDHEQVDRTLEAIYASQPNLLASVLSVGRLGPSRADVGFLLRILLVCFEAMERSSYSWNAITEADQEKHLSTVVGSAKLSEGLSADLKDTLARKMLDEHREKYLLAFVVHELEEWKQGASPTESGKFVLMCAMNLVECIASGTTQAEPQPAAGRREG